MNPATRPFLAMISGWHFPSFGLMRSDRQEQTIVRPFIRLTTARVRIGPLVKCVNAVRRAAGTGIAA